MEKRCIKQYIENNYIENLFILDDPNAKPSKVGTETITVSKHITLISNYSYCGIKILK